MSIVKKETYDKVVKDEYERLRCVISGEDTAVSKVFMLAIKDACDLVLRDLDEGS